MRRLLCEHQEITSDMAVAQFLFSVPSGATPSFETPIVALKCVVGRRWPGVVRVGKAQRV